MRKMTAVLMSGCILSGALFLTASSVLGQAENKPDAKADKDQIGAPKNPADDQGARQGGGQRQQGPRNFDPQKMQQQMMDNIKESIVATDEEWKVIQPLLEKVMTMTRELRSQGRMGFRGGRGGPGADAAAQQPTSEIGKLIQALKTTLDNSKSTPEEIKASLSAVREAKKKSEQDLAKAREELVKALTPRQEARLVQLGIID